MLLSRPANSSRIILDKCAEKFVSAKTKLCFTWWDENIVIAQVKAESHIHNLAVACTYFITIRTVDSLQKYYLRFSSIHPLQNVLRQLSACTFKTYFWKLLFNVVMETFEFNENRIGGKERFTFRNVNCFQVITLKLGE